MTLRHLKIFVSVCEHGTITRTAEALHITQPAISHTIAELERYYSITLFDRINQRLVLTDVGKEVLQKAREIVRSFDEFEDFVSSGSHSPKVRIGCSLTLGQTVIPSFLQLVREQYPHIQPQITIKLSAALEEALENGTLDFALIEGEIRSPYLTALPFKQDNFVFVANTAFSIPDHVTVEELCRYPLLLRERGSASREFFERMLGKCYLHCDPAIDSANNQALVAALYASAGVALLPESYVKGHIQRGKFRKIQVDGMDGNHDNYLVIHKNKKLNAVGAQAYHILEQM